MSALQLRGLRLAVLFSLLPGLGGLLVAATLSTHYLETLPRMPVPQELRYTPRNIHGTVVYETEEEDRRLATLEYVSAGVLVVGLGLGMVYLRQWGIANAISAEEDEYAQEQP
ncbi:hypothetical protein DYQ86_22920 [Acidobacteria bacterium AB60]|nr:hypothetical protein DYQ86_22920 [Acidobacteria bacterium AB60]